MKVRRVGLSIVSSRGPYRVALVSSVLNTSLQRKSRVSKPIRRRLMSCCTPRSRCHPHAPCLRSRRQLYHQPQSALSMHQHTVGNYVKVVSKRDDEVQTNMLRATMKQMEDALQAYPMIVRCHRAFMVNLGQVEQISSNSRAMQLVMRHSQDAIPVSRSNVNKLKELLG